MLIIMPLIIGAIVGALMAILFNRRKFLVANVVLGIVGALIFRLTAYAVLATKDAQSHGFTAVGFLSSLVGALALTYVLKLFPPLRLPKEDSKSKDESSDQADKQEESQAKA